jgi:hypothetical protein
MQIESEGKLNTV